MDSNANKRPRRGSTQIYEALREDILWLQLAPGSALDEVALASRFNVSRTPVREALLLLAGEDLVTLLPNRTSIVAHFSLDNMGEYLDVHFILSRAVARSAAMCRSDEDIVEMKKAAKDFIETTDEGVPEQILRTELELRRRISQSARNQFLDKFYGLNLDYGLRAKVLHFYKLANAGELGSIARKSSLLVEAIGERNPEESDTIMSELLTDEIEIFNRCLEPRLGSVFEFRPSKSLGETET